MKMTKILFTVLAMFLFTGIGFSQSAAALAKMDTKAAEKVEQLNAILSDASADLALNEAQKTQIQAMELQKMKDIRTVKKSDMTEEEQNAKRKEINKAHGLKLKNEVLSKEQMKARGAYNKARKMKKN